MRRLRFVQVDVFAERPFAGNPLAVFPDAAGLSDAEMQAIAREMNLSETTFVTPPRAGGDASVRIFTPELELPFAGHPSVGTAVELVRLGAVAATGPRTTVVLELGVGPTAVEVDVRDGVPVRGTVLQRAPRFGVPVPRPEAAAALGLEPADLHPELEPVPVDTGLCYVVTPLVSLEALGRIVVPPGLAVAFERRYAELYPCAFTGDESPWVEARGLFPSAGIPEDPATGSAAGPLAAYMARAGRLAPGVPRVVLQGARIGRPSHLTVVVSGPPEAPDGVRVGGAVQPVLEGELTLRD